MANSTKVLYQSKPTIWYYLLALLFPVFFFLIDDAKYLIMGSWEKSAKTYLINSSAIFLFWGVPILMLILRREISIYPDKIIVRKPVFNLLRIYLFSDLIKWNITDIYVPRAGRQINLTLKFKNKKLTLNKIELSNFSALKTILEKKHKEKYSY